MVTGRRFTLEGAPARHHFIQHRTESKNIAAGIGFPDRKSVVLGKECRYWRDWSSDVCSSDLNGDGPSFYPRRRACPSPFHTAPHREQKYRCGHRLPRSEERRVRERV